ncbi:MAG TPA: hypothetical protein VEC57_13455 [Candidatus Limnocylindrales bacterium]|nr:hypothetical protein [Candidatus Limnocylindrales bacterium]
MHRPIPRALATILLLTAAGCALPEVRPLVSGPTPGPSPYGPWYEQHWQVNAVMIEPADADALAAAEEAAAEDAVVEEGYADTDAADTDAYADGGVGSEDAVIPPDDNYEPLPPSEPGAANPAEPLDSSLDAAPAPPRRPAGPARTGDPVRY